MAESVLIGDAGGSKTDWRLILKDHITQYQTKGFNAFIDSIATFKKQIAESISVSSVDQFHLYCAGAHTLDQKDEIASELRNLFDIKPIVESDLLGAARATCGKKEGYVGILGTGSNASYYDGSKVENVSASLGYVLGDEGGGAYLGKQLLKGVYRKRFSAELIEIFQSQFELPHDKAISDLYATSSPNHYLGSFVPFILNHKHDAHMHQMILDVFRDFFHAFFIDQKADLPIHFVGSIAHLFSEMLREVATEFGFHVGNIVASPIAGLVLYHSNE